MGARAEGQRGQGAEHGLETGVGGWHWRADCVEGEGSPAGPVVHALPHLVHEFVATLDQGRRPGDPEGVRRHDRGSEVRGLSSHDETGEGLVGRQHDQRHPKIEIGLGGTAKQIL